jgi:hypothetical protein
LALGSLDKQFVDGILRKDIFHRGPHHDSDRALIDKPLQHFPEDHGIGPF